VIENSLYDTTIWSDYLFLKNLLDKHPYLEDLYRNLNEDNMKHLNIIRDYCKYKKLRIDYIPKEQLEIKN